MAYIRTHETAKRRNGKVAKRYEVVWREPAIDAFGRPLPVNPAHPNGQRSCAPDRRPSASEAAEARRDELNAAKHTTGTSALTEQRKAGELPFGHYARASLDAQAVKVSQGRLKQRTVDEHDRLLRCYVFGSSAGAPSRPSPRRTASASWPPWYISRPAKATAIR
jgi:hypothetical protein